MKKLALHWKIIIGMALGVVYGLIANKLGWMDFTKRQKLQLSCVLEFLGTQSNLLDEVTLHQISV